MPKRKKQPKDMTTEELAKTVFHPKLHQKLHEKIKEFDEGKKPKIDSNSSS
jgi:predicted house-cleaning noncanonical NTP pyrophosphatase (MazG superfamily)